MNPSLHSIKTILTNRKERIAIAESVTGGDVQSTFSLSDEALRFFEGGITVYNLQQKVKHLHVDPVNAKACNCVSEQTASEMAAGVARLFASDWGISITGYASPVPEKGIEELFAWIAFFNDPRIVLTEKITAPHGSPSDVRWYYKDRIIRIFLKILSHS